MLAWILTRYLLTIKTYWYNIRNLLILEFGDSVFFPEAFLARHMLVVTRNKTRIGDVICLPAAKLSILLESEGASPWELCLCVNQHKAPTEKTSRADVKL